MLIDQQKDKIVIDGERNLTFVRNMQYNTHAANIGPAVDLDEWKIKAEAAGLRFGVLEPQPAWYRPMHISNFHFVVVGKQFRECLRACWTLWKWLRATV